MSLESKTISSVILAVSSVVCARTIFAFIDDPEGPNLLVVFGLAAVIFVCSAMISRSVPMNKSTSGELQRSLVVVLIQILLSVVLYFLLR